MTFRKVVIYEVFKGSKRIALFATYADAYDFINSSTLEGKAYIKRKERNFISHDQRV